MAKLRSSLGFINQADKGVPTDTLNFLNNDTASTSSNWLDSPEQSGTMGQITGLLRRNCLLGTIG